MSLRDIASGILLCQTISAKRQGQTNCHDRFIRCIFREILLGSTYLYNPRKFNSHIISGLQQRKNALILAILLDGRCDGNREAAETHSVSPWSESVQLAKVQVGRFLHVASK